MKYFPVRYRLILATFSLTLILYIDRVAISAAKSDIGEDLSLSDTQMGWILSAFALGYALFQLPGGMMSDRMGPRRIITLIVSAWSFFTFLTGTIWNFVSLWVVRFLFGAGEAGAFPGIARANFSWIPMKERGLVTGINFSGSRLGAAFAFPIITLLINSVGWRVGFYLLGGLGLAWAFFWFGWFRDLPENHPSMKEAEKDYILATRQAETNTSEGLNPGLLLKSGNLWLAMGQYFGSNFIFFFCLTWMFPYLRERFSIAAYEASFYSMLPFIFGVFGNLFSGWLVDVLYIRLGWRRSRSVPAIIGFVLVVMGIGGILISDNLLISVISLSVAVFGADMTLSPSWSFCIDIGKSYSGTVSAAMNMAGNIGSFVTAIAFPYLFSWTGTYNTYFIISIILVIMAIVAWLFMNPSKAIISNEKV